LKLKWFQDVGRSKLNSKILLRTIKTTPVGAPAVVSKAKQQCRVKIMEKAKKEQTHSLLLDDFPNISKESWKKEVQKKIKTPGSYKDLIWITEDGIEVEPLYTKEEAKDFLFTKSPPPGKFPFVRGTRKKDNGWLLTEDIKLASVKDAARDSLGTIERGADSLTFILESKIKTKVVETLIKDIDPLSTRINFALRENPKKVCDSFISSCRRKGIDTRKLCGILFFDPLSHLLERGSSLTPLDDNVGEIAETIRYLSDTAPGYAAFSVKSSTFKNSGATIAQELAFTLAAGVEYMVLLGRKKIDADRARRHLVFSFSSGSSYFSEIAKLRAARALWAKIVEEFSPSSDESTKMKIHCSTTTFNKTIYDPHVNILRTTLEAMASIIGGTDSLTVHPFDSHYREPDEFSRRVARNIQLVIRNESRLDVVTDPGGGSYHIEKLTHSISEKSLELFQEIERRGGYLECIKNGFMQNEVKNSREKTLDDISRRKKTLVGTNEFPNSLERMAGYIQKTASTEEKTNISDQTVEPLAESRASQEFEKIRLLSEKYTEKTGEAPKVLLLHLSDFPQTVARSVLAKNFFEYGGFKAVDAIENPGTDEGVEAALGENPIVVAICGSNEDYERFAEEAITKLKDKKTEIKVVVSGGQQNMVKKLRKAGADDFINEDSDVCKVLERCQQTILLHEVGT